MHLVLRRSLKFFFLTGRVIGYLGRVGLTHKKIRLGLGEKKILGLSEVFFESSQKILTGIAISRYSC